MAEIIEADLISLNSKYAEWTHLTNRFHFQLVVYSEVNMSDYKKILVCTDFSENSDKAVAKAVELASRSGATLTVLHVVTYVPPAYTGVEIPARYASGEYLRERAEEHLASWCDKHVDMKCRQVVRTGHAKSVIHDTTVEEKADLLVIGAAGESGLVKVFGSVAGHVVQHAECDILVVK